MFESGVKSYIKCKATVEVGFPVDFHGFIAMTCQFCKYYRKYQNMCGLTEEIIYKAESYVGYHCPLEIMEEQKNEKC